MSDAPLQPPCVAQLTDLKAPPNDRLIRDAERDERRFCSLIIRDADCISKAMEAGITFEWLWTPAYAEMYRVCAKYWFDHKSLMTMPTYESMVGKVANTIEAGTRKMASFIEVFSTQVTADEMPHLISQVVGRHAQRLASTLMQNWYEKIMKATNNQMGLVEQFKREALSLELPTQQRKEVRTENLSLLIDDVLAEVLDRREDPAKYFGILSGFKTIDNVFHGFQRQRSLVFCAPEGGGKTSVMLNFANNQANLGYKVAYVTVESPAKDIEMRSLSREAMVDFNRIMTGGREEATGIRSCDIQWVKEAAEKRKKTHQNNLFYITADYDAPWTQIVKDLDALQASVKLDAIYVDYLDVIGRITDTPNRPDIDLGNLFKAMVNYGKRNDIFMGTAMQLKADKVRDLWKQARAGKEIFASTADVSGTRIIGGIADYMILLMIDPMGRKRIKMYSMKARMAPSGEPFILDYIPEMMLLKDAADQGTCDVASALLEEDPSFKDEILKSVIDEGPSQEGPEPEPVKAGEDESTW